MISAVAKPFQSRAFSLVELLVVVAVLSVLAGLVVINGPALLASGGLRSGSQLVSDSLALARNMARSRNSATYVVIRSTGDQSWQRLAVFSLDPTSQQWKQLMPWKNIPQGAFIDQTYDPSAEPWSKKPIDLTRAHAAVPAPSQVISDAGQNLTFGTDYLCIGFWPSGALISDDNLALRIVRGVRNGSNFIAAGGNAAPADWVKLIVEKNTGRTKELRPNES
jgi:prepilin-type N-terminal cleavage/methylation domain-containing protein